MKNLLNFTAVSVAIVQSGFAGALELHGDNAEVSVAEFVFQETRVLSNGPGIESALTSRTANTAEPEEISVLAVVKDLATLAESNPVGEIEFSEVTLDGINSILPATVRRAAGDSDGAASRTRRRVLLSNVEFEGNTAIDSKTLGRIASAFVGRLIGLSDLEDLRVQLTRAYVDRGYVNSGAVLPDQKVENGNIVFEIVEGSVKQLNIKGAGRLREKYISDRLLRKDAAEPFNAEVLQENFQLLLEDPLIERIDGQIESLPVPGLSVLNLDVTRARPFDLSVTTSNHGTLSLGSEELFVDGVVHNVSGRGDQFGITFGGNGNKFSLLSMYEIPVKSDDTRVKAQISVGSSTVAEDPLDVINIESQTASAEIGVTRPLIKSLRTMWTVGSGLAVRQNTNTLDDEPWTFANGEEDGKSRVSVARLWQDYVRRRPKSVFAARTTLNYGLEAFGATSHDDGRPDSKFLSTQLQLQYVRRFLRDRGQLLLRFDGQIANNSLLPLERFALGGAGTVRGFVENAVVRDEARFGTAEFRYSLYRSPNFGTFQLAPFLDLGYGRNNIAGFRENEFISSAGIGMLWSHKSNFYGELYIGSILHGPDRKGSELQERGIHLKLKAAL